MDAVVPSFFLFGEAPKSVDHRFLHIEALDDRSRPNEWNIRPHAHDRLCHVFLMTAGEGVMTAEGEPLPFRAPCLIVVPAGVVHGLSLQAESAGQVLTLSADYLDDLALRDRDLAAVFRRPMCAAFEEQDFALRLALLERELNWRAPGHVAAVEGLLLSLLADLLRLMHRNHEGRQGAEGPHVDLVARYRQLVEERYRRGDDVRAYAQALGVTSGRLRDACQRVAGGSPMQLVHERIMLEARRALLYSNMTVAEVAFHLGFEDPAYFSRFFTRHAGCSPRAFRGRGGEAGG
ncbi:helix-turn-helix domain-containing protein [Caulobacter sp. 73W]|uniref:Helix-turn-helix domain-containing protein n=1 Tax=Caulobacter sp. 73W TaxID=3161137 RepID=A0AB39KWJ9_9CAUL